MNPLTQIKLLHAIYALILVLIGYFIANRISLFAERTLSKRFSRHHTLLVRRILFYIIFSIFLITGLQYLGFNLSVLLGAAGIFTVAVGFASQTAASNLISGIFLIFEHPFKVGDNIEIKGITGIVDSIDLLSTKLKTANNTLVRIPNEVMIKSEITNLNYFPVRRIDITLGIAYENNLAKVKSSLLELANSCETVLKKPEPTVIIHDLTYTAVELILMVWATNANAVMTKNSLQETIKQRFEQEGIAKPLIQSSAITK